MLQLRPSSSWSHVLRELFIIDLPTKFLIRSGFVVSKGPLQVLFDKFDSLIKLNPCLH